MCGFSKVYSTLVPPATYAAFFSVCIYIVHFPPETMFVLGNNTYQMRGKGQCYPMRPYSTTHIGVGVGLGLCWVGWGLGLVGWFFFNTHFIFTI